MTASRFFHGLNDFIHCSLGGLNGMLSGVRLLLTCIYSYLSFSKYGATQAACCDPLMNPSMNPLMIPTESAQHSQKQRYGGH